MSKKALVWSDDGVIMALNMASDKLKAMSSALEVDHTIENHLKSAIRYMRRKGKLNNPE